MAKNEATLYLKIKDFASDALDTFREKFVITAGDVINFATKMAGTVVDFVKDSVAAYREEELAINELTQAMINQGVFTGKLRQDYLNLASALQETTTYGDEQIVQAISILQAYTKGKKVTDELTKATLDFAAAKKIDLASAADLVGKAIGTETNALGRYGIALKDAKTDGDKLQGVIDGINKKFAGQAEAQAKGLGAVEQAKNAWSDFMETIGRGMAEIYVSSAKATIATANFLKQFFGPEFDSGKASIQELDAKILELTKKIEGWKASEKSSGTSGRYTAELQLAQAQIEQYTEARQKLADLEKQSSEQAVVNEQVKNQEIATKRQEDLINKELKRQESDALEIAGIGATDEQKLQLQMSYLDRKIGAEENANNKLKLIKDKDALLDKQREMQKIKEQQELDKIKEKNKQDTLNTMATLQNSNNKTLAGASKAFAAYEIAVSTPQAISKAMAAYPPPFNYAAAGLVAAAMAKQAAALGGVKLAEGGIVRATPGGIQATIGEGGKDEAVIPLDDPEAQSRLGGGGRVTVNFNGPVMGDESQAMEFARHIDRALLKLRQSNQSLAFEEDIF